VAAHAGEALSFRKRKGEKGTPLPISGKEKKRKIPGEKSKNGSRGEVLPNERRRLGRGGKEKRESDEQERKGSEEKRVVFEFIPGKTILLECLGRRRNIEKEEPCTSQEEDTCKEENGGFQKTFLGKELLTSEKVQEIFA